MKQLGVVGSMKDFYWDIRPKPGYGTVELRICDTPLTVEKAAALAAYAQALGQYYLTERPYQPSSDVYELYTYNRFQACRFGAQGNLIDPYTGQHTDIGSDILASLQRVMPYAEQLQGQAGLKVLQREIEENGSDTRWLRNTMAREQSIHDVARLQARRWMTPAS
jgi:carboxylate-amine ligase